MKPQRLFYILLILWVLVDLLQAVFTPIHADEAYYALYGSHLDWGYYDHPPMVALLTAFSSLLFHGNLSVRFSTVLLHGGTVWLIWQTLPLKTLTNRDVWTFFAIAASLVMFSVYGFVTTPDAPLLFFTALFFYLYSRYLSNPGWPLAIALGVTLAAMLYSKYMAVLVAGFVLLSNFKLLKDKRIWVAILLAALLFVPHVLWQVHHNFPSFQYHLLGRNKGFRPAYLLEYIPNQLLVFNPVCLCLAIYFCWKKRKTDELFERACLFTIAGFLLFFWVMTVKGHAEPHWTVAASVPMIILLWQELRNEQWHKWLMRGVVPFACLLLLSRVALVVLGSDKVHLIGRERKMKAIHEYCGQTPVVFTAGFQYPSLYSFYTGGEATVLSSFYSRFTQFDLWQRDLDFQGKRVCLIGDAKAKRPIPGSTLIRTPNASFTFREVESFQGANRIQVAVDNQRVTNDTLYLKLTLHNPYTLDYRFDNPDFPTALHLGYIRDGHHLTVICPTSPDLVIPAGKNITITTAAYPIPCSPFVVCLDNNICRSVNSVPIKIKHRD